MTHLGIDQPHDGLALIDTAMAEVSAMEPIWMVFRKRAGFAPYRDTADWSTQLPLKTDGLFNQAEGFRRREALQWPT